MSLMPEPRTIILHKGEGPGVNVLGRHSCTFKLTAQDTMGHFGLFECKLDPQSNGTSPHTHHEIVEIFYVLNGELDILAGNRRVIGRTGSLISVPPDVVHAFRNFSNDPVEFLLLFCPAQNREEYFKEVAELARNGALNDETFRAELDARFDTKRRPDVKFP